MPLAQFATEWQRTKILKHSYSLKLSTISLKSGKFQSMRHRECRTKKLTHIELKQMDPIGQELCTYFWPIRSQIISISQRQSHTARLSPIEQIPLATMFTDLLLLNNIMITQSVATRASVPFLMQLLIWCLVSLKQCNWLQLHVHWSQLADDAPLRGQQDGHDLSLCLDMLAKSCSSWDTAHTNLQVITIVSLICNICSACMCKG